MAAGEGISFRPREIKTEAHNLIRNLAILAHQSHFARIVSDLLTEGHLPVPRQCLIEEGDDASRIQGRTGPVLCGC